MSLLLAEMVLLVGCSRQNSTPNQKPSAATKLPEVEVVVATSAWIVDFREYTGRTAAVDAVDIRPRVSGYLLQTPRSRDSSALKDSASGTSHPYHDIVIDKDPRAVAQGKEGDANKALEKFIVSVGEGDLIEPGGALFEIDPEPYRLAYQQAAGNLEATKAQMLQAQNDFNRQKDLVNKEATSKTEYDAAVASLGIATGQAVNLQAVTDRAYLDWQFTQIRSPIRGLVGRAQLTRGNLAIADTTVLTTVVMTDPIYVYFNVDENSSLDYRQRVQQGKVNSARNTTIKIAMSLANETDFPHEGTIDFVDNTTDPASGNTSIRGRFDNPKGVITPGLFARVRTPFTSEYSAVLIPTLALASDQQGRYVMVVDEHNQVHRRTIVVGSDRGDQIVIRDGVEVGEQVIVAGLQRVRDGANVRIAGDKADNGEAEKAVAKTNEKATSQ